MTHSHSFFRSPQNPSERYRIHGPIRPINSKHRPSWADREAAAQFLGKPGTPQLEQDYRDGTRDAFPAVQALARHRIEATAELSDRIKELEAEKANWSRMFPRACDVLTDREMREAKGSLRSLIDQQNNWFTRIDTLTKGERHE